MKSIGSIAVIGAGAIGLYYGGRLAQAGHEVHFFSRSDADALRSKGLTARSHLGDFRIEPAAMKAYDRIASMPKTDWVISSLKATARPHYRELIAPLLHDSTAIVALQNGIGNEEELAEHFGADRVLGAIAYVCIHRTAAGEIDHTAQGELKVGAFNRPISPRVTALVDALRNAKIDAHPVDDLRWHRWHKLVWNIAFNGHGAALDLDCAELLSSEAGRSLLRATMHEVICAAKAVGVLFDDRLVDFQIDRTAGIGAYRTSMHLDRLAGRPMEIDALLGEPLRQAAAAGVSDLPLLNALHASLRTIDAAHTRSSQA